jgi:hypothetical protein
MKRRIGGLAALTACALLLACQGDDDDDCPVGSEGCACTSGGACDEGLVCLSNLCVESDAQGDAGGPRDAAVGGDADSPAGNLVNGVYYEDPENWSHFEIVNAGTEMRVYVISDEPETYCGYTSRGELADNPSTGFVVDGVWHSLRAEDTYCGWIAEYAVLSQTSSTEIALRSSTVDFETAYGEATRTFTRE